MEINNKLVISGCFEKKKIVSIININNNLEYTYERILFLNEKSSCSVHSMLCVGEQIYIVDSFNGLVYKYDFINNKSNKIAVGKDPRHIAKLGNKLYITNFESNSISVIDINKFSLIESVPAGIKPHDIICHDNSKKIFVTCYEENQIIEYIGKTSDKTIMLTKGKPIHIQNNEDNVFVLSYILKGNVKSKLNIIDIKKRILKNSYIVEGLVTNIKYDKDNECIYMINIEDRYLYKVDLLKDKTNKACYLGGYPEDIDISDDYIYVTNSNNKSLTIINKLSGQIENIIDLLFTPECMICYS